MVLGAGTWGTTLSILLNNNGHTVSLWHYKKKFVKELKHKRKHPKLSNYKIPNDINVTNNIKNIAKKIQELNLISDIRPDSFASGCILLYCNYNNININKKQISKISKISEVTINKCFKKLENNIDNIFD